MQRIKRYLLSGSAVAVIGGLLYAGLFIKPKPAGKALPQPLVERGDAFYGMAVLPDGRMWAVGTNGKILHSDDAGQAWRLQRTAQRATLQDIAAWDARRAVAVGNDGVILATADGGVNWQAARAPRSSISNKLMRVQAGQDGRAWAVGSGGVLLRSLDYGNSWESAAPVEDTAWNGVAFDGARGCVVGEFGRIRVTRDAGEHWTTVTSPARQSLMSVRMRDDGHAVAVGLRGTVLVSSDAGTSWNAVASATQEDLFDVAWDGSQWVAVGDKGVVLLGGSDGAAWRATRFDAMDRGWYTRVLAHGGKYYAAGSRLAAGAAKAL